MSRAASTPPSRPPVDPVAIIGMAFRFPGGNDTPVRFWDFIRSAEIAICDTPRERFDVEAYYSKDMDALGTTYSRKAGYVGNPYTFDHDFFRISRAEALEMDPQQRWMLELSWSALEHAGIVPSEIRGKRVGLFLTAGDVDYARRTVGSGDLNRITTYGKLGTNRAVGAGRVAYTLGVHGPAIFVDSTCSSSLVAIHLAAQSLRCHDCDLAIAGGTNLILGPEETIGFARLRAMSPSDHCRAFDGAADGYIRAEGGAVVVVKRADDATADGDRIEALLVGSSVNNDGASNGLTAPNATAQEAVIRQALAQAGARPVDVAFVETHGTGTPLGDPIELTALRNVYAVPERGDPLLLGAVKAQIGHLEGAAGIAGLIKAVLVLRHGQVPRQAAFDTPNPRFRWEGAMMDVPSEERPLPIAGHLVGVSSFGISGTNAHMLLAPAPTVSKPTPAPDRTRILTLSARSQAACGRLAEAYLEAIDQTGIALRDLCHTASLRRQHWDHRVSLLGSSPAGMADALREFRDGIPSGRWHAARAKRNSQLVFLFPGQGAWRPGIGAGLYRDNPIFRCAVDDCLSRLSRELGETVRRSILESDQALARHHPGQLAHFVILHSLARTWIRLGIVPDRVIGHSLGEHAAAVIAGIMSLDDGLRAVEARGRLFEELRPAGAMLAVNAGDAWLAEKLPLGEALFVAAINGPEQTVLSGTPSAIAAAEVTLASQGIRVSRVQTYDTPGHSQLLAPILTPFREALASIALSSPKIRMIPTVTGPDSADELATVDYWVDMIQRPVRFREALKAACDDDAIFLEVGPGAALSNLARAAIGDPLRAISSLCDGPDGNEEPEPDGFAYACGRLYAVGRAPDWSRIYGTPPQPVEAPTYAFEPIHLELPALLALPSSVMLPRPAADLPATPVPPADCEDADLTVEALLAAVTEVISPVTGPVDDLDVDAALLGLGFESLALMELRARLKQHLGSAVPMSLLAGGGSLRQIAAFYARSAGKADITGRASSASSRPAGPTDRPPATERNCAWASSAGAAIGHGGIDRGTAGGAGRGAETEGDTSLVVTLRDGAGPILALVHPVGGDVLCYAELASLWPGDAKIVAVRHPESESGTPRFRTHAELARLYRRALFITLGEVPDVIGGWSFGASIAQEMAAQWESEGRALSGIVAIDGPLPDGDYIRRARGLIAGLGALDEHAVQRAIEHPKFRSLFDAQHGLDRLEATVDAETADRLLRVHAANAVSLGNHVVQPIRTPLWYALALRTDGSRSGGDPDGRLAPLSNGPVSLLSFDCDHFTIMQAPAIHGVAGFLGAATRQLVQVVKMDAE
jgi:acyl transferase domain-containing protein/thioesterase domain-containing protein